MRRKYPPDFEAFFKAYPTGDAKASAFVAWQKTEGIRPPLAELIAAIEQRQRYHQWLDANRKFVPSWPYGATWLNGARWEDRCEIPMQRAQPAPTAAPSDEQQQRARMNELAHEAWLRIRAAVLSAGARPMFGWGHAAADDALARMGGLDAIAANRSHLPRMQGEFIATMVRLMTPKHDDAAVKVVELRRVGQ